MKSPDIVELPVNVTIFFFFPGGDAIDFCLAEKITPNVSRTLRTLTSFVSNLTTLF